MHPAIHNGVMMVKATGTAKTPGIANTPGIAKTAGTVAKVEIGAPFAESLAASLGVAPVRSQSKQNKSLPDVVADVQAPTLVKGAALIGLGKESPRKVAGDSKISGSNDGTKTAKVEAVDTTAVAPPTTSAEMRMVPADSPVPVPVSLVPVAAEIDVKPQIAGEVAVEPLISVGKKGSQAQLQTVVKGPKADGKKVDLAASVAVAEVRPVVADLAGGQTLARHESAHGSGVGESPALAIAAPVSDHAVAPPMVASALKFGEVSAARANVEPAVQASDLTTMTATPNVLEIGVASGSHGWLRVRAELGPAGEVAASVVAASAGAAESLHKELPAISAYLAEERVGVGSLVVNAMEKGAGVQDSMLSAGGAGAGAGPQPGAGQRGAELDVALLSGRRGNGFVESDFTAAAGLSTLNQPWMTRANGSGSWVNVRV